MSEAFVERLSRFTPDPGGLDRDALLFAAGRHSARPNRFWMGVASVLAGSQALSLFFLISPPASPPGAFSQSVATVPVPPEPSANPGAWSPRRALRESVLEDRPADDLTLIDSGPPLRAFAPPPPSLVN